MKRVCKQCGTTFELSDSEIAFYRKKNLHLPKRCKECRQANKQSASIQESKGRNVQKQEQDFARRNKDKGGKWVYALIAVSVLLLFGLIKISTLLLSPINDGAPLALVSVEDGNASSTVSTEDGTNADLPISVENENSAAGEAPPDVTVSAEETAVLQDAAEAIPEETVSEEDTERQYTFRNSKLLNEHFEKHGKEMGFSSAEEYQAAASAVVNNANALHKTEKEDGDDVYYLEATNEFVIVSTDGFIRTYFLPNAGIDYYNRQ